MKINLSKKTKYVLSVILILIAISLLGNTNNNPVTFIERVFKPIHIGEVTYYYAVIIPILFIYYGLKWVNESKEYRLINTRGKRIIATIIVLLLCPNLTNYGIKLIKSTSGSLNAIYFNRDFTNSFYANLDDKGNQIVTCRLELENCGKENQEFYIKVLIPEYYKDIYVQESLMAKESDLKTDKKFVLHPKEKKVIMADFSGNTKEAVTNFTGSTSEFEFSLINDNEEVKFIKKNSF
jgi:hypothetical protein